ncbi:MAG TPA: HNH endonuclease signature motif containing protein [Candidatus Binatia bacterium]|nr:HNH endonuclease signature motif containing protein [Candidatus Binatia bacterium]
MKPWTAGEEARLRKLYPEKTQRECATLLDRTPKAIASRAKLLKVRRVRKYRRWTKAEDRILRQVYANAGNQDLARRFKTNWLSVFQRAKKLGLKKSPEHIARTLAECGRQITVHPKSVAARYPKGHEPANKGTRRPGWFKGRMRDGWFKKGHKNEMYAPKAERPLGALRVSSYGYIERKIRMDGRGGERWQREHYLIWIAAHGPVPKGHIIVFKDRDKTHITLDNLECISFAENMRRNTIHVRRSPELKETIYALIALKRSITMRERRHAKELERSAGSTVRDVGETEGQRQPDGNRSRESDRGRRPGNHQHRKPGAKGHRLAQRRPA